MPLGIDSPEAAEQEEEWNLLAHFKRRFQGKQAGFTQLLTPSSRPKSHESFRK
jgi:hypothetical protein